MLSRKKYDLPSVSHSPFNIIRIPSIIACMKGVPYVFNCATFILQKVTGNSFGGVAGFSSTTSIPTDDIIIDLLAADRTTMLVPVTVDFIAP